MDVFPVPVLSLIVVTDLIIGNRGYVNPTSIRGAQSRECRLRRNSNLPATCRRMSSKNSKANRIETAERSGGIGEICSVEVDEK
jgi:hypothetical protein